MSGIKCKKLIVTHLPKKGILEGPKSVSFDYQTSNQQTMNITVYQKVVRIITISSNKDIDVDDLYNVYIELEKLLMLFDGVFIPLEELKLEDSSTNTADELFLTAQEIKNNRLSYYETADFCKLFPLKLLDFTSVLDGQLLSEWASLLDDLDIIHQIILYFSTDNHMTVDCRCAFLIESAEGMVELLKRRDPLFPSSSPKTLKECLGVLIDNLGPDIFTKEISKNKDAFLTIMKDSRIRIMHIKPKHPKIYFNGEESVLYVSKLLLLYRHTLLHLLVIDESKYKTKLIDIVDKWDNYNNILSQFLNRI